MTELKGFKFVTLYFLALKAQTIINDSDIDDVFESIYNTIMSSTRKTLGKGSIWIIDSVVDHTINVSK